MPWSVTFFKAAIISNKSSSITTQFKVHFWDFHNKHLSTLGPQFNHIKSYR